MPVYPRGKKWHIQFEIKKRRFTKTCPAGYTEKQAKDFEIELKVKAKKEIESLDSGYFPGKTFGDVINEWMDEGFPDSMLFHLRVALRYLEHEKLEQIIPAVASMKKQMIKKGNQPATINRKLAIVKKALNIAYELNWLKAPLAPKIKFFPEDNERQVYLSKEEVDQLVAACEDSNAAKIIKIAGYTGLRRSEILKLTEKNIIGQLIRLDNKTKNKKPRTVPIHEEIYDILVNNIPFNISIHSLRWYFEKARNKIGHPEWHLHDLRHTFASWLSSNPNIPWLSIRDLLGHKDSTTSSRYAHLRVDHLVDAVNKIHKVDSNKKQ